MQQHVWCAGKDLYHLHHYISYFLSRLGYLLSILIVILIWFLLFALMIIILCYSGSWMTTCFKEFNSWKAGRKHVNQAAAIQMVCLVIGSTSAWARSSGSQTLERFPESGPSDGVPGHRGPGSLGEALGARVNLRNTGYLWLTLVFAWNSSLREKFNFYFPRVFC